MNQREPTRLEDFLNADSTQRQAALGSESSRRTLIQDLEELVGCDAARVVEVGRAMLESLDDDAASPRMLRAILGCGYISPGR